MPPIQAVTQRRPTVTQRGPISGVGLAGNLADYEFEDRNGKGGQGLWPTTVRRPATPKTSSSIVYVSAHDNETLWDITQFKLARETTIADRVRVQNLVVDFTVLSQGVPFLHAGVDTLRSKSLDRDSYNSGDWFNYLDWTYGTSNWGVVCRRSPTRTRRI